MFPPRFGRLHVPHVPSLRRRSARGRHGFVPRGTWLEDRTLLAAPLADPFAAVAIPIALGTPTTGTLAANTVVFYQINPSTDGRLIAQLHAPGGTTRLTLLDGQDHMLLRATASRPPTPTT